MTHEIKQLVVQAWAWQKDNRKVVLATVVERVPTRSRWSLKIQSNGVVGSASTL